MAQRVQVEIKENVNPRNNGKGVQIQPLKCLNARSALGEVGNKFPTITANGAAKKLGIRPPQVLHKKQVEDQDTTSRIVFKKQSDKTSIITATKELNLKTKEPSKDTFKAGNLSKSYSSKQYLIIDPDESSKGDPQCVNEYIADIFAYLQQLETDYPVNKDFLENHQTTPKMRTILVNWLAEVATNFKLHLETFHLCVSIVDRYLQESKTVGRSTLQLVGTAAMLVAAKYEEMYLPELSDFVYICDDTFSAREILLTEMEILKKLNFSFGRPLSVHFLRRYNKIAQVKSEHHTLGKYILELTLMEYELSHIKPSIQAAAACCLSIAILNAIMDLNKVWTPTLIHYTTYKINDFRNVLTDMAHMLVKAEGSKYQTIRSKYASSSHGKISLDKRLSTGPLVRKLTSMPPSKK